MQLQWHSKPLIPIAWPTTCLWSADCTHVSLLVSHSWKPSILKHDWILPGCHEYDVRLAFKCISCSAHGMRHKQIHVWRPCWLLFRFGVHGRTLALQRQCISAIARRLNQACHECCMQSHRRNVICQVCRLEKSRQKAAKQMQRPEASAQELYDAGELSPLMSKPLQHLHAHSEQGCVVDSFQAKSLRTLMSIQPYMIIVLVKVPFLLMLLLP